MLASPIPSSSPYNLNLSFDFNFDFQPACQSIHPHSGQQPLAPRSHNVPSPKARRTIWREQQPLMAKRSLRSRGPSASSSSMFGSQQPQEIYLAQPSGASFSLRPCDTQLTTALDDAHYIASPSPTSHNSTRQTTPPQNPLSRTPSQRRRHQRAAFLNSVSERRENHVFESRGERMLHLQALEENRKWEAERARQAVVEAGTLDVDEAVEDDLGGERKDGEVDGSVVEGVDSEALEDVLTMEEREMQELVAAHEQHDTRFDPFHTRTEEEFERPCEGWMRYHACQHGSGHCGYLEAQRQGQAGHDRRPEGELPQMDERMDEGFDGAQSGVQDAGSIWGSDDTDSSFEDELWRLGDQITDTGAGGGDEMDMS